MTPEQLTTARAIVRRLARRFARGDEVWAEDLEQEAMLRLVRYADRFDPQLGAWEDFVRMRALPAIRAARRRRHDVRGPVSRRFCQPEVSSVLGHPDANGGVVDWSDVMPDEAPIPDRIAAAREELGRIVGALTDEGLRLLLARELLPPAQEMAAERGVTHSAVSLWRRAALAVARKVVRA